MSVNPTILPPPRPGPWVDEDRCSGCGELASDVTFGVTFEAGAQAIRAAARADGDDGGGFRSRRAVLWAMRVLRLEAWYWRHQGCGVGW